MSDLKKIAWIGGYPAHYMCELHTRLEEKFPGRIHFFYVEAGKKLRDQRTYERGMLPNACEIIRDDSYFRVFRLMKKISQMDPGLIITASHYPRPIWLSALYFMLKKKNICYWSDTNIQDIFFKPVWWQFAKKTIFGFYLKKMFRLLYMGRQNKNFYIWATNRLIFDKKKLFFPYPHNHAYYSDARDENLHEGNHPFTVVSVGRLNMVKRYDLLIEGISLLPKKIRDNFICHIAGDGPEKDALIQKAKNLNVDHLVNFAGPVPSDEVMKFFQKGNLFILPSDIEPWGLVVNEALSSGVPVAAPYWVGAASDLVVDGETGILLPDNNPGSIAQAIIRLYERDDWGKHLGIQGQDRVRTMGFHVEKAVENFCKLVEDFDAQSA